MENNFKYSSEDDKCYGIAGMAVGMVVWDCENMLSSVSLDVPADESIEFAPEFYYAANQNLSAKVVWNKTLEHYQLYMGMLISNVVCRNMVLNRTFVGEKLKKQLYSCLEEEGKCSCSLETDEIKRLFDKNYEYVCRIFNHHGVQDIVRDFVLRLKQQRRLSRADVVEGLRALSML
ncbi:MAG: hypothetical protein IJY31_05160 [Muribaculaceae bacterium]|nr:hypothetical protein [Muribaculaceae bacterium]